MLNLEKVRRGLLACASTGGVLLFTQAGVAQEPAEPPEAEAEDEEQTVIVTGSRFGGRSITESPTPIDSIGVEQLTRGGANDLQSMLKVAVPSFSTPRPSAAGASDFLTSPTMRGLSTGQLLVLLNGKRRHTNSDLNTNQQIGRGDVAYEFSAIPPAAIKTVEVLRDGAAAQYGSDAIAGVINVILDDSLGYLIQSKGGATSQGDGDHYEVSAAAGFGLGDGSIRFTTQYVKHDHTDRAEPDTRQQYFSADGTRLPSGNYGSGTGLTPANGTLDPREATVNRDIWVHGEPDYTNKSIFSNLSLPLGESVSLYSFAGYNEIDGTSYNFLRRAGQDETVRSIHPDGFLPLNRVRLTNWSAAAGLKGQGLAGFNWDFSSVIGNSLTRQANDNANNASLGAASPLYFDRGASEFEQWTTNLDLSRDVAIGGSAPLRVAFGAEYREETYELKAGEPLSYANGGVPILDGPNAGRPAPIGSQAAAGISPLVAGAGGRDSYAIYAELEKSWFDRLLLSGAMRYEEYSDFGDTTNARVAARLAITEPLAIRASYGTGFRAPALAQIRFASEATTFLNGVPVKTRQISLVEPLAALVGAPSLEPEESKNLSVGAVLDLPRFTATLDLYRIKLTDRLTQSSIFQGTQLTNFLTSNGFPGIVGISFVTNGIDTTTEGVDLVATYRHSLEASTLTATLAANFNETEIDRTTGTPALLAAQGVTAPLTDLTQQVRLTQSTPNDKVALNLNWRWNRLMATLGVTRYGEVSQVALTNRTPAQVAVLVPGYDVELVPVSATSPNSDIIQTLRADVVTDLDLAYDFTDRITVTVGASNIFDKYPEKLIASTPEAVAVGTNGADNVGIIPFAPISPYGTSGRFMYLKAQFKM